MVFMIGTTDISEHILADSYSMNADSEYEQWQDGNYVYHRVPVRIRIKGSFKLKFKTETDYNNFINLVKASRENDGSILCTAYVNNLAQTQAGNFFYTLTSIMRKNVRSGKTYNSVQMKLEER